MSGFSLDFSDFAKGLAKLVASVPDDLDKGLFRAGNELLRDAVKLPPKAPFLTGALRRSRRTERPADTKKGEGIMAGFNIEYAARWHEINARDLPFLRDKLGRAYSHHWPIHWTAQGVGPKYLESKLMRRDLRKKYTGIIASYLTKRLNKLGGK